MEITIGKGAELVYRIMVDKLSKNQVLVPKLRTEDEGLQVIGWRLKNIRRLNLSQIEAVVNYAPQQLVNNKRELLAAREGRLRGMRR